MGLKVSLPGIADLKDGANRLNNYMKTVDEDLRNMQEVINQNFTTIGKIMKEMETKLDRIKEVLENDKNRSDNS